MCDDIVEVARDAGALAHHRLVVQAVGHRAPSLVALGNRLPALPARVTEREGADDDEQQEHAARSRGRCRRTGRSRSRGRAARAAPTSAAGISRRTARARRGDRRAPAIVKALAASDTATRTPNDDRARRPRQPAVGERERQRRQEVRPDRRVGVVRVDRHLGERDQAEHDARPPAGRQDRPGHAARPRLLARSASATSCNGSCGAAVMARALSPAGTGCASSRIATFGVALAGELGVRCHPRGRRPRRLSSATTARRVPP